MRGPTNKKTTVASQWACTVYMERRRGWRSNHTNNSHTDVPFMWSSLRLAPIRHVFYRLSPCAIISVVCSHPYTRTEVIVQGESLGHHTLDHSRMWPLRLDISIAQIHACMLIFTSQCSNAWNMCMFGVWPHYTCWLHCNMTDERQLVMAWLSITL